MRADFPTFTMGIPWIILVVLGMLGSVPAVLGALFRWCVRERTALITSLVLRGVGVAGVLVGVIGAIYTNSWVFKYAFEDWKTVLASCLMWYGHVGLLLVMHQSELWYRVEVYWHALHWHLLFIRSFIKYIRPSFSSFICMFCSSDLQFLCFSFNIFIRLFIHLSTELHTTYTHEIYQIYAWNILSVSMKGHALKVNCFKHKTFHNSGSDRITRGFSANNSNPVYPHFGALLSYWPID